MDYLQKLIRGAYFEHQQDLERYLLSLFGGSIDKWIELAPLYVIEEHHMAPAPTDQVPYTISFQTDIRIRPKNPDEIERYGVEIVPEHLRQQYQTH